MKRFIVISLLLPVFFQTLTLRAATPAEDVKAAVAKLADAPNYSWTVTEAKVSPDVIVSPAPPMPSPSGESTRTMEGKSEKNGYSIRTITTNTNSGAVTLHSTTVYVSKGDKSAKKNANGTWTTLDEMVALMVAGGEPPPPPTFLATLNAFSVTPATQIAAITAKVKEFTSAGGVIKSDLPHDDIVEQLQNRFSGTTYITPPFSPKDISGTLSIWLKDGALAKYELHIKGTVTSPSGGSSQTTDYTLTTEIKDVGTTKVDVPPAAIAKLEGSPASVPVPGSKTTTVPSTLPAP